VRLPGKRKPTARPHERIEGLVEGLLQCFRSDESPGEVSGKAITAKLQGGNRDNEGGRTHRKKLGAASGLDSAECAGKGF